MRLRLSKQTWALIGLGLVVAVLPSLVGNNYQVFIFTLIGLMTLLTIGLSLVMGYAGQVSLGHATFYGLGAYATALLSTRAGLPPWAALLAAVAFTSLIGFALGVPIFRLRGHYLAMATLGLNVIFILLVKNEAQITGGPSGYTNIPPLALGGWLFDTDIKIFYVVWLAVRVALWLSLNLVDSRVGRALRALHTSEVAAEALGVDVTAHKLRVFALGAALGGLAGGLYAQAVRFISPSSFDVLVSVELVTMAAIGGLANVWGSIFGAATVVLLAQFIRDRLGVWLEGASGEGEIIVFGLLLIFIMVLMPEGLTAGVVRAVRSRLAGGGS